MAALAVDSHASFPGYPSKRFRWTWFGTHCSSFNVLPTLCDVFALASFLTRVSTITPLCVTQYFVFTNKQ